MCAPWRVDWSAPTHTLHPLEHSCRAYRNLSSCCALIIVLAAVPLANPTHAQEGGVHMPPPDGPWTVYLTFDDGPSTSVTPQILDILQSYGVHATFFLHGNRIGGNEELVQRMIREGHAVGNHLWQQDGYTNGSRVTDEQLQETWQKTDDEIIRALGPRLAKIYQQQPDQTDPAAGRRVSPFPGPGGRGRDHV